MIAGTEDKKIIPRKGRHRECTGSARRRAGEDERGQEFTRLPFVAVLGYFLFAEVPDAWVWIGAAIIFGSSLSIAHRENAAARKV